MIPSSFLKKLAQIVLVEIQCAGDVGKRDLLMKMRKDIRLALFDVRVFTASGKFPAFFNSPTITAYRYSA